MVVKTPDVDAIRRLQDLASAVKPQPPADELVIFRVEGQDEVVPLAQLKEQHGDDLEEGGEQVFKTASLEQRIPVWQLKTAKNNMVSCPADGCKGKFPVNTDTCPTCDAAIDWADDTPTLKTGKTATKTMSGMLTDKASVRYMATILKSMTPDHDGVKELVAYATENNYLAHLPKAWGGSDLDWDATPPEGQKSADTDKDGEMQAKKPTGPNDQKKDMDDDGIILDTAYDWPDTWITAISSLCSSFTSTLTGLDNLMDAQGEPGLGVPFASLLDQLVAGIQAIYNASGEETDAEGTAVTRSFTPDVAKAMVQKAITERVYVQKAGKRHSKADRGIIEKMHDAALTQHENALALQSDVCPGECPMNPTNLTATKSLSPTVPDTSAEAERLQAVIQEKDAEVQGLQAKIVEKETELDRMNRQLSGFRRARDGSQQKLQADPLETGQSKQKTMVPHAQQNVYELLVDDEDHRIADWRLS